MAAIHCVYSTQVSGGDWAQQGGSCLGLSCARGQKRLRGSRSHIPSDGWQLELILAGASVGPVAWTLHRTSSWAWVSSKHGVSSPWEQGGYCLTSEALLQPARATSLPWLKRNLVVHHSPLGLECEQGAGELALSLGGVMDQQDSSSHSRGRALGSTSLFVFLFFLLW